MGVRNRFSGGAASYGETTDAEKCWKWAQHLDNLRHRWPTNSTKRAIQEFYETSNFTKVKKFSIADDIASNGNLEKVQKESTSFYASQRSIRTVVNQYLPFAKRENVLDELWKAVASRNPPTEELEQSKQYSEVARGFRKDDTSAVVDEILAIPPLCQKVVIKASAKMQDIASCPLPSDKISKLVELTEDIIAQVTDLCNEDVKKLNDNQISGDTLVLIFAQMLINSSTRKLCVTSTDLALMEVYLSLADPSGRLEKGNKPYYVASLSAAFSYVFKILPKEVEDALEANKDAFDAAMASLPSSKNEFKTAMASSKNVFETATASYKNPLQKLTALFPGDDDALRIRRKSTMSCARRRLLGWDMLSPSGRQRFRENFPELF